MSDALPLPPRSDLEQYRKLAKDLQQACKTNAIEPWAQRWLDSLTRALGAHPSPEIQRDLRRFGPRLADFWRQFQKRNENTAQCKLSGAQFFIARAHGFASWPEFAKHLQSPDSPFEAAADAITSGDIPALAKILRDHPDLIRAHSLRDHHSTLLHYVAANGIEDYRQKTPPNILEITKLLLDAGADPNAESDAYGGGSTPLGLAATSYHPEKAGAMLPLLDLLIDRGARLDGVVGSLANGRGEAAEHLAKRGARLDLEGACGVGRLDLVQTFIRDDATLNPPATPQQLLDGFKWACEFGRIQVIEYLLHTSAVKADALLSGGETGLHWAGFDGNAQTVRMLLDHGAKVDIVDATHGGTPLSWTLYGWGGNPKESFYETVALLARAGATLNPEWYEGDEERQRAAAKLRADPRMQAALSGEIPISFNPRDNPT